jgi:SOS response regulatory protein OraA/RecX
VPTVTALQAAGRGRVRVELDGEPWRILPVEAAARAGVAEGVELDRPRLRTLARELRRARALDVATRALARRDLPERGLRERLRRAGITPKGEEEALGTLRRTGLLDDGRYAVGRAESLAERGFGDAAICFDLERQGVDPDEIEAALAVLEPERDRAAEIAARRGGGPATARYLARRGFDEEAVEATASLPVAPDA